MNYETLTYKMDGKVAVLTYNRPQQRNAINRKMNEELQHAWQRFRDDDNAYVLVTTGAGEAYCSGWDLEDAAKLEQPDWEDFRRNVWGSAGECGYTRRVDVFKPVIAAVNGWAVAAGLENALLADIRIVGSNAVFGAFERRWNIVGGDGLTVRLPLIVGFAKALELIITGRAVGAEEAFQIGLANQVVEPAQVLPRAMQVAHGIASLPQGAIRADKETVLRNVGRPIEERLRNEAEMTWSMFMRKDSHTIGAKAFKAKQMPPWPNDGL